MQADLIYDGIITQNNEAANDHGCGIPPSIIMVKLLVVSLMESNQVLSNIPSKAV